MKKTLLMLIALFTVGQMCRAQQPLVGKPLKANAQKPTVRQADTDGEAYWVDAQSYYGETGLIDFNNGTKHQYKASIAIDGTDVTINDLMDFSNYKITSTTPLKGTYDATNKTITIQTPVYQETASPDEYTQYGKMTYFGTECDIVLFAGNFADEPDETGQYPLYTVSELVFDVSDDLSTLTPRTGFGCFAFTSEDGQNYGFLDYYKTATLTKMQDEASLYFDPETVTFSGASVTVGAQLKKAVTLINKGKADAEYTANVYGDDIQFAAHTSIPGGSSQTNYVMFNPQTAGVHTGHIDIIVDGNVAATLNIVDTVSEAPDFSQIVLNGDIAFSFGENFPYVITDTITGSPVAVSTNAGSSTQSDLYANVTVPEGKVGMLSWKGMSHGSYGNGIFIMLDGDENQIFSNRYAHGMSGSFDDDISNTVVLTSGSHQVHFNNYTNMDWNNTGEYKSYVYDFDFQNFAQQSDNATLKSENLDFGDHYFDKLSALDTLKAVLVNLGSNSLKVNSIKGDGVFSGIVPTATAAFGEDLSVEILYNASGLGQNEGDVVISTSAGDFTVHCTGNNVALPTDYQPIVTKGDFSFNTSSNYPFAVDGNKAYNATTQMERTDDSSMDSWLEASFEIPEGKVGKLSWTGHNSSYEFFIFMNDTVLTSGTMIVIDGQYTKQFAGEDVDCSSSCFDDSQLTFAPGRHSIRWIYQKRDYKPKYDDRVDISNLALDVTTGINGVMSDNQPVRVEVFSANGIRQNGLTRGVNIVKTTYSDGTVKTEKRILK
ncbi:MAG: hypothetical protein ACOYJG_06030 [Prevotella sp.]|jgi:hypothetical protein